jgi:hypothetical protein
MNQWFSYDSFEGEYNFYETEKEAIENAKYMIDHYLSEGVPEDILLMKNGTKRDILMNGIIFVILNWRNYDYFRNRRGDHGTR